MLYSEHQRDEQLRMCFYNAFLERPIIDRLLRDVEMNDINASKFESGTSTQMKSMLIRRKMKMKESELKKMN